MPSCAFLTIDDLSDFVSDDDLAAAVMRGRGWQVDLLPWNRQEKWSAYDLVAIRTTWDYHEQPDRFLEVLGQITRSETALYNPLSLVRWNLDKRYLRDLEQRGALIVPTTFADYLRGSEDLAAYFLEFGTEEVILKPLISANASNTFHVPRAGFESYLPGLLAVFGSRPYLAQPFMPNIRAEGEYSLIYFNGRFSHAILKTPSGGDFRVQEEHGGLITAVMPEETLLEAGQRALDAVEQIPLYGRVDLVRDQEGVFRVMELELIEPSLYLRMDPGAPERFADALAAVLNR